MRKRTVAALAVTAVIAGGLAACGGGGSEGEGSTSKGAAAFNAAIGKVYNASDKTGGTLRFANSGDWDSLDPADTYYAWSWNFVRLYGRALTMFASAPGQAGTKLVPDLAESLGTPSDGNKTWTYKLRSGVKFEDGTPVTSKDVKYAVERSLDKTTFPNGPTYFNDFLDTQGYTSPYQDTDPNKLGLKAIETPDDQTIVFHMTRPYAGFDYFAMQPSTIPVPQAKDTGSKYKEHVIATGPYKFETNELGKQFTLVRNDQWDASTDPNRKPMPDKITVQLNVNSDDIDNRLLSGDLDVDVEGSGVRPAAQGRILSDQSLKANADSAITTRHWYSVMNVDVPPLDNIHCRKAIEYAWDKVGYQNAYGGPIGGEIATGLMPPVIPGFEKFDLYDAAGSPSGNIEKAKAELQECGQPNGFATNISYRVERPKEKAVAEAEQQALAKIGVKLTVKPYPQGDYFKLYAGKPAFTKANKLGIMVAGWAADWPDGFGFLEQITDSRVIHEAGNSNLGIKIPAVDALIDKALVTNDTQERDKIWGEVDKTVMENAVLLPGVWSKGLLYRPSYLTNVFVNDGFGGEYDYATIGTTK